MTDPVKTKKLSTAVVVVLIAILAIKTFLIGYYRIPQNGMYPTLPSGSRLFVLRHAYSDPSKVKRENGQSYHYIWRVVGLPGEKIEATGESLAINGHAVERKPMRESEGRKIFREQIGDVSYEIAFDASPRNRPPDTSVTIPAGEFFVMGDNRFDARDSRYFGPVSFASIIGKKL